MTKFVIIGMGHFGRRLSLNLMSNGYEVTVLDECPSVIDSIKDDVSYALIGDATDSRVLEQLDLLEDKVCVIVAIGEGFERSILITAQLKELGAKKIYARCVNQLHANVLKLIGVRGIFRVEDVAAEQLASRFMYEGLMSLNKIDKNHALADARLPSDWIGKRLCDVDLRSKYQLNLLTIRRSQELNSEDESDDDYDDRNDDDSDDVLATSTLPVIDFPTPDLIFLKGDVLVLFGKDENLEDFANDFKL